MSAKHLCVKHITFTLNAACNRKARHCLAMKSACRQMKSLRDEILLCKMKSNRWLDEGRAPPAIIHYSLFIIIGCGRSLLGRRHEVTEGLACAPSIPPSLITSSLLLLTCSRSEPAPLSTLHTKKGCRLSLHPFFDCILIFSNTSPTPENRNRYRGKVHL